MKSSSRSPESNGLVLVGRVSAAHGIRGGLKIHSYAESTDIYRRGEHLVLALSDGTRRPMVVKWVKPHGRKLLMALASIDDRNQAEGLVGAAIYVDKADLPDLEADTYYWFDLLGLEVQDRTGQRLGRLVEVIATPGNDVYVVKGEVNHQPREWLLPAVGEVILEIDLDGRVMTVDPPEGL